MEELNQRRGGMEAVGGGEAGEGDVGEDEDGDAGATLVGLEVVRDAGGEAGGHLELELPREAVGGEAGLGVLLLGLQVDVHVAHGSGVGERRW